MHQDCVVNVFGGSRGKVRGSPLVGFILWGPQMSAPNVIWIRPIVVELFQSGLKWWTDTQTDIAIHRALPLAWLKYTHWRQLSHYHWWEPCRFKCCSPQQSKLLTWLVSPESIIYLLKKTFKQTQLQRVHLQALSEDNYFGIFCFLHSC